jgi:death-on-curing protein
VLFIYKTEVIAIQRKLIEEFGGIHGLRDEGTLESALATVENRIFYESIDIIKCAATYAYHLTQAHAFIDGNKRVAAAVSEIFLEINGKNLNATDDQMIDLFLGIASGEKSRNDVEQIFSQWILSR